MSRKQHSGNGIFLKIKGTGIHFTGSSHIMCQTGDLKSSKKYNITDCEKERNQLVYQLDKLTEVEIAIVEGNLK